MVIEYKDVLSISGVPGLHRIIKSDDRVIIVESIDGKKKKRRIKGSMLVSKLSDISMYTDDGDSEMLLAVFQGMAEKYGDDLPVTKKSKNAELLDFLGNVLPNYDTERVYASNVKKLLSWYKVLRSYNIALEMPEVEETEEETTE